MSANPLPSVARSPGVAAALGVVLVAIALLNLFAGLAWFTKVRASRPEVVAAAIVPASAAKQATPESPPFIDLGVVSRWLAATALLALVGAVAVERGIVPRARRVETADTGWLDQLGGDARSVGRAAAWLLLFATLALAAAQLLAFYDPAEPFTGAQVRAIFLDTVWGRGWLTCAVVAVAGVVAWTLAANGRKGGAAMALIATLAVVLAHPLLGHGMAGRFGGAVGVGAHAVHLLGAGLWIGTLGVLTLVAWPVLRPAPAAVCSYRLALLFDLIPPLALVGGALSVGAGALMGLEYSGGWRTLLADSYGRTLLIKDRKSVV